jgi:hypothetical protein
MKKNGLKIAFVTWIIVIIIEKFVELNLISEALIWFFNLFCTD